MRSAVLIRVLTATVAVLVTLFNNPLMATPPNGKTLICHVGSEEGPDGQVYDPDCVPDDDYDCSADAGKIDLIEVAKPEKHLNQRNGHSYGGISDYLPSEVGASGIGNYDDDDSNFVDEGCEPGDERVFPCADRTDYFECRPWSNEACILGLGPCECNWDATFLDPFGTGEELCPGSNEAEPKDSYCVSGNFCQPIPCEERVTQSQCRPDNCHITGACSCTWDAVNIGFEGDECPGINEDDPCPLQIAGAPPFCTTN